MRLSSLSYWHGNQGITKLLGSLIQEYPKETLKGQQNKGKTIFRKNDDSIKDLSFSKRKIDPKNWLESNQDNKI